MPRDTLALHARVRHEARQAQLEHLGYADYTEYLNSPHWRAVRRRYRESDRTQMCICGKDGILLHHKTYERLGAEQLDDLIPLCGACHDMVHALKNRGEFVDYAAFVSLDRANQYFDTRADRDALTPKEWHDVRLERHAEERRERSRARRKRKQKFPRT